MLLIIALAGGSLVALSMHRSSLAMRQQVALLLGQAEAQVQRDRQAAMAAFRSCRDVLRHPGHDDHGHGHCHGNASLPGGC